MYIEHLFSHLSSFMQNNIQGCTLPYDVIFILKDFENLKENSRKSVNTSRININFDRYVTYFGDIISLTFISNLIKCEIIVRFLK